MSKSVGWTLVALLLLGSVASLVGFGIVGIGRGGGTLNFDGAVLYAAGRAWLAGKNPYNHTDLVASVADVEEISLPETYFFYLPQAGAICILLASLPYPMANLLWVGCNLLAIAAIAAMTAVSLRRLDEGKEDAFGGWILAAVIIGNPFTTHVVWMGQTTLVAFAATLGAWFFAGRKRWLLAGMCLGLASFKPQICVLVVLWLLLERDWKTLLVSGITAIVLAGFPIYSQGPIGTVLAWQEGIRSGYDLEFNQPGNPHKVGLESLLYAGGVRVPMLGKVFLATGIALTIGLWVVRQRFHRDDVLSLLMVITFTFVGYTHDYDFVALVPVLATLWRCGREHRLAGWLGLPLVVLLFVPQRLVERLGVPVLLHWRTLVVVSLAIVIVAFSMTYPARQREPAPAT